MSKFKIYFKAILIPVLVGAIIGILISGSMNYESLIKPPLAPPGILFPIVWTTLYVLMGVSYGILRENSLTNLETDYIYYGQLIVNALWPVAFFILKWRFFSVIWIILLAILVLLMISRFYKLNKTAGLIQIPYLVWTVFATYLNIGFYILNK